MTAAFRVHHVVSGPPDAPAVVLSNSLGTDLSMWDPQAEALADSFRVIRYDTRGHGGSPAPHGAYAIADLGRDLLRLLDDVGVARAHVVGLSLGGMTAMWVAANAPERVETLVLLSTSARLGPPEAWAVRARLVLDGGMGAVADMVMGRWFTSDYAAGHPDVVAAFRQGLLATSPAGYARCCHAIQVMDLVPDLARITAPTLVVGATEDLATPPEHALRIGAGIGGSRVAIMRDAAHLVNVERPDNVTRLIVEHLAAGRAGVLR